MEAKNEMSRTWFLGNGNHNPHGAQFVLSPPAGGPRTRSERRHCIDRRGLRRRETEWASRVSRIVESRGGGKVKIKLHGGD